MPKALTVKQFGLPRWVWLTAIGGGIMVGLYLRSRKAEEGQSEDTAETAATTEELPPNYSEDSGSGGYMPEPVGADTGTPIDVVGLLDTVYTHQENMAEIRSATPTPTKKKHPIAGGGPPKKPKPKVKAKPGKRGAKPKAKKKKRKKRR